MKENKEKEKKNLLCDSPVLMASLAAIKVY